MRLRAVSNLGREIYPKYSLTTPLPKCSIGRENYSVQQLLNISLGSYGKLLMHNWAMKSVMGYDYVLLGYHRKTTLRWSHQDHFNVKLSKIIKKNIFTFLPYTRINF